MTRKEFLKYFKHLLLLMVICLPVLIVLNMFAFKGIANDALIVFLDVVIALVMIFIIELTISKIKKDKEKNNVNK